MHEEYFDYFAASALYLSVKCTHKHAIQNILNINVVSLSCFSKWKEEEEIFQLLYKYYNRPEEMLVPAITPGVGLPREIVEFYYNFQEQVKKYVTLLLNTA